MELNSSNAHNIQDFILNCFHSTVGAFSIIAITITCFLFLPVNVFILYLGHQQWRQQGSTKTLSHSDCITYHVVVLELLNIVGSIFCCCAVFTDLSLMAVLGFAFYCMKIAGQMLFNILTCVERYLAVVHPVTYMSLRTENGTRARNIVTGCVWILSVASMGTVFIVSELALIILSSLIIGTCVLLICVFSVSVLCVLTRPKPGEEAGARQWVNQSKLRAFYTIMLVLGLLLLRSGGNVLAIARVDSLHLGQNERCGMWFSIFWFCLPSTLVLPLMFLQRAGKLCIKQNKSDQTSNE